MKEKPNLQDQSIADWIWERYGLHVTQVEFLPIGDVSSAKYRITSDEPAVYFLKLRRGGFKEISVSVPRFLYEQGVHQILSPLQTIDGRLWTSLDAYTCILYPYIDGRNGFTVPLSDDQWIELGAALKGVHSVKLPPELQKDIPGETFAPDWRESARDFVMQAEKTSYDDPVSRKMAAILHEHRDEIRFIVDRAEDLAKALQSQPLDWVLCHTDIHAGNLLIEANGSIHLIDWDDPMLAPKERDLMFFGGGVGGVWNTAREEDLFYRGYGAVDVNWTALTYFRYERIIIDIAEFSRQILLTAGKSPDRQRGLEKFSTTFLPGQVLEIAYQTDREFEKR